MEEIQHGNKYECKETCIFYILTITSSTNFNDFIFESSCSPLEDGFVGEQRDQSESVSLDKLTGIRFRDIIMTKIEATSPGPPSPSSSSSPGLTPLLPILQTHSTRSIGPGSCDSQDAQDAHQRPQRRGNKEVLELVLGSR